MWVFCVDYVSMWAECGQCMGNRNQFYGEDIGKMWANEASMMQNKHVWAIVRSLWLHEMKQIVAKSTK